MYTGTTRIEYVVLRVSVDPPSTSGSGVDLSLFDSGLVTFVTRLCSVLVTVYDASLDVKRLNFMVGKVKRIVGVGDQ